MDVADPMVEIIAPRSVRDGNERADAATSRGMLEHPEELRAFINVCEMRATRYRAFLAQLARLMISVARRAEAGIKEALAERAIPETVFGKKRMAHMVPLQAPQWARPGPEGGLPVARCLSLGPGPCTRTRWARRPSFLATLRRFWEATRWTTKMKQRRC